MTRELPDGLLDGTVQADNVDPTELNDGIVALVRAARQSVKPEPTEAFEELEAAVFDPLQEENRLERNRTVCGAAAVANADKQFKRTNQRE